MNRCWQLRPIFRESWVIVCKQFWITQINEFRSFLTSNSKFQNSDQQIQAWRLRRHPLADLDLAGESDIDLITLHQNERIAGVRFMLPEITLSARVSIVEFYRM